MAQIGYFYLEANGVIGSHEAAVPQILRVVPEEEYVQEATSIDVHIKTDGVVFWNKGKIHETSTDTGMTVIII